MSLSKAAQIRLGQIRARLSFAAKQRRRQLALLLLAKLDGWLCKGTITSPPWKDSDAARFKD